MSLQPLLTTAAFAPIADKGWLRVTGPDRLRWLNGMTTNNISVLTPGQGCYTFFLNAQGRILVDAAAFLLENFILLETASPGTLATHLDHFIIMDDVELTVLSLSRTEAAAEHDTHPPLDAQSGIILAGPQAALILGLPEAPPLSFATHVHDGQTFDLIHAYSPLVFRGQPVPTFELWATPHTLQSLISYLRSAEAHEAAPADLEALRILSGTPLYGADIRNTDTAKDLPQETNQTRALNFTKGCYLGQEIVERIRSRGQVHRTFTGFTLHGEPPQPGQLLTLNGKSVGELTSVLPASQLTAGSSQPFSTPAPHLALGYIRREALTTPESIQYPGGSATPTALPFSLEPETRSHNVR